VREVYISIIRES